MEIFTRIYDQDLGRYVVLEIEFDEHEVGTGRPSFSDRFPPRKLSGPSP